MQLGKKVDCLKRDKFVKMLVDLIEQLACDKRGSTFAIDGQWGIGKSFVINMLEKELKITDDEMSNKFLVCKYNCWQYDYYEEPLCAIVTSLQKNIKDYESTFKEYLKKESYERAGAVSKEIVGGILKCFSGIELDKVLDAALGKSKENIIYGDLAEAIVKIREKLAEIAKETPILVIVDELDRCMPGYAIKVLERLHHVFSEQKNIIVVLGIDQKQLEGSIKQIYGSSVDTDRYLKKFIDFSLYLNTGELDDNWFSKFEDDYFKQFRTSETSYIEMNDFLTLFMKCINAREQEKVISKAIAVNNIIKRKLGNTINLDEFMGVFELVYILFKDYFYKNGSYKWFIDYFAPNVHIVDKIDYSGRKNENDDTTNKLNKALTFLKSEGTVPFMFENKNRMYFKNNGLPGKFLYGMHILKYKDIEDMNNDRACYITTRANFFSSADKLIDSDMKKYMDFLKEVKDIVELI